MEFHAIPRYSMVFHCIPLCSMLFQAIPWYSIIFHIIPRYSSYSMVLHCIPYYSTLFQAIPLLHIIAPGTGIEEMGLQESPRGKIQGRPQEPQNRQQMYLLHYIARDQPQACVPIAYCVRSGFAPNRQSLDSQLHIPCYSLISYSILFVAIPYYTILLLFHVTPCYSL